MRHCVICVFSLGLLSIVAAVCVASDKPDRRLAITEREQVDEDFAFQGEYLGTVWTGYRRGCCRYFGLQVAAQGSGEFLAAAYWDGLPGYGWCGQTERLSLKGTRAGDAVVLEGDDFAVTLQGSGATVHAAGQTNGPILGRLEKTTRQSSTLGARPPYRATVLFDGNGTEHFKNARTTETGLLEVGTELNQGFGDYYLHLEFRLPYMPYARGQGRSNSGVYLQSRYEVQILDSFALEGKDNECGGLYKSRPPDVNMCFPPLTWQTYDVQFTSPRFDTAGNKVYDARLTVWHNGVAIHDDVTLENKTGAGAKEDPRLLPIKLQNHGNPVHFRNIWLIDYGEPETYMTCPTVRCCRR